MKFYAYLAIVLLGVTETSTAEEAYRAPDPLPNGTVAGQLSLDAIRQSHGAKQDDPISFGEFIAARARLRRSLLDRAAGAAQQPDEVAKREIEAGKSLITAVASSGATPYLIGEQLSNYLSLKADARLAPQATQVATEAIAEASFMIAAQNSVIANQNSTIIQQNEKIILLLQRLVDKK